MRGAASMVNGFPNSSVLEAKEGKVVCGDLELGIPSSLIHVLSKRPPVV